MEVHVRLFKWWIPILLFFGSLFPSVTRSQVKPKYNVLLILTHDMNDHVDFLGNPEPKSPNFDRLAAHGIVFRHNYCQYPLCSPSRTSFLSGLRPDETHIYSNEIRPRSVLGDTLKFLPEYFKKYGYRIERYGTVLQATFENDIAWDYAEPPELSTTRQWADGNDQTAGQWWLTYTADSLTTEGRLSKDLVNRLKQPQPPLFFYALGFTVTHSPFTPNLLHWNQNGDSSVREWLPDQYGDTTHFHGYGSSNILLPQTPENDRADIPPIAFLNPPLIKTEDDWKKTIHAYDGEVSQLDAYISYVLDELDRQDLWKNTVVVFLGDHGQHLGEHGGTWLKMTLFEESVHVPLIICVPGKKPGVCDQLTESQDLYPTLAEICGLPQPPNMEGTSFAPLLDNPSFPWKRASFSQVSRARVMGRTIRTLQFRYTSWGTYGEELYDHDTDPHEYTNQVTNPAYSTTLNQMRNMLAAGWTASLPPHYPLLTFFRDADGDGYGNDQDSVLAYAVPPGYVTNKTDCNDANRNVHPGAKENVCNGIDDNCDGHIDEGKPVPRITALGNLDICETGSVQLQTNAGTGYLYQWKKNGINIAGATKRIYTATSVGTYMVVVSLSNGCNNISKGTTVTSSCVDEVSNQAELAFKGGDAITVYPNPSFGNITVVYRCLASTLLQLTIFDLTGTPVYHHSLSAVKGTNNYRIELGHLASGIYQLEIKSRSGIKHLTLVMKK